MHHSIKHNKDDVWTKNKQKNAAVLGGKKAICLIALGFSHVLKDLGLTYHWYGNKYHDRIQQDHRNQNQNHNMIGQDTTPCKGRGRDGTQHDMMQ